MEKLRASDGIGRESLELAQAHRSAKVPRNGWEGGTYNNNNDHNVLMLCTMSCETNENFRQENLASALNGEELVD